MGSSAKVVSVEMLGSEPFFKEGGTMQLVRLEHHGAVSSHVFLDTQNLKPGDKIDLSAQIQRPTFESISSFVLSEIQIFGELEFEETGEANQPEFGHFTSDSECEFDDEIIGEDYGEGHALTVVNWKPGLDPIRTRYLQVILDLLLATGEIVRTRTRGVVYLPELYGLMAEPFLQIGAMVVEYKWKFSHEEAAIEGHVLRQRQKTGRDVAATERKRIGIRSKKAVFTAARAALEDDPLLLANNSKLAKKIIRSKKPPLKENGEPLGFDAVRQYVSDLKSEGEL